MISGPNYAFPTRSAIILEK